MPRMDRETSRSHYIAAALRGMMLSARARAAALESLGGEGSHVAPIGLFAEIDAGEVAKTTGKTRGAISNIFGSQLGLQIAVMKETLFDSGDAGGLMDVRYPDMRKYSAIELWIADWADIESRRGPRHGNMPGGYASKWLIWLTTLPYEVWSSRMAEASRTEFTDWVGHVENEMVRPAIDYFSLSLRPELDPPTLARSIAHAVEGVWLSQCTDSGGSEPTAPMRKVLEMIWRGAVAP